MTNERVDMNISVKLIFVAIILCFFGCVSSSPQEQNVVPLNDDEIEFLKRMNDPNYGSVVKEPAELMPHLDRMLREWRNSSLNSKSSKRDVKIYSNLSGILTRLVYLNFDKIMNQLEFGIQPNRVVAAAALGFSRIPENDKFPQVYFKAIPPLLRALESEDDSIIQNSLLALGQLKAPLDHINSIMLLMAQHHNPDVRANAALCLSHVIALEQSDLVIPYVLPALRDDEPKVRLHAISILKQLEGTTIVAPLVDMMDDRYPLIRANAARVLGNTGDITVSKTLIENLIGSDVVKIECLKALKRLTGEDYGYDDEKWTKWWNDYTENPKDTR